jgi:hypothetical protein
VEVKMVYKLVEAGPFRGTPALFIDEYEDVLTEEKFRQVISLFNMTPGKRFAVLNGSVERIPPAEARRYSGRSVVQLLKERGFFVVAQSRPDVVANHVLEANSLELFVEPGEDWMQCRCNALVMKGIPDEDWYCEDFLAMTPKFLWLQMKGDLNKLPSFLRMNSYPWVVQIGSAGPLEVKL